MMWFYQMSTTVWDGARSRNNAYEVAVKRWRRLRKGALDARKLAADRAAADGAATSAKWAKAVSQRAAEDAASPYPNPFPIMIPNSAEDRAMLPVSKRAAADSQDRGSGCAASRCAWKRRCRAARPPRAEYRPSVRDSRGRPPRPAPRPACRLLLCPRARRRTAHSGGARQLWRSSVPGRFPLHPVSRGAAGSG